MSIQVRVLQSNKITNDNAAEDAAVELKAARSCKMGEKGGRTGTTIARYFASLTFICFRLSLFIH
jgi:hypothetical protein